MWGGFEEVLAGLLVQRQPKLFKHKIILGTSEVNVSQALQRAQVLVLPLSVSRVSGQREREGAMQRRWTLLG